MENRIDHKINSTIAINATEIINKFKHKQDRINFCLEKNWNHPEEPGFDSSFFLKVLMGEKKFLPNNFAINYDLKYFRHGEKLDKSYIISKMMGNLEYAQYTPDNIDPHKLSKKFLLTLVSYVDHDLFKQFYAIQKKQTLEKAYSSWKPYKIDISKNLLPDIENYISTGNESSKRSGGFHLTKNKKPSNTFYIQNNQVPEQKGNSNSPNHMINIVIHKSSKNKITSLPKNESSSKDSDKMDIDNKK